MDKAREIIFELIEQRKYNIIYIDENVVQCKDDNDEIISINFINKIKLNIKQISDIINNLKSQSINHCIIVYEDTITSMTYKAIQQCIDFTVELFHISELQYNITKHELQPIFKKIKPEEIEIKNNLPCLMVNDPISRFYNFVKNDIIEITDKTGLVYHRIVK